MKFESTNQGLVELAEVLDFAFTAKDALKAAKENDGKISIRDWPLLFGIIDEADEAYTGIEMIPAAWESASDDERAEVVAYFCQEFDLPNDVVELKIEKALKALVLVYEAITL